MNSCEICTAIDNSNGVNPRIWNTCLFETEFFKVLPTIGPLTQGHIIITSKRHCESLASMSFNEINDFIEITRNLGIRKNNLLLTEHGSSNGQVGGGCIVHTHIHVIPGLSNHYDILKDVLPILSEIKVFDDLHRLKEIQSPYILNINSNEQIVVYEAYNAHSQMMRKAICAKLNRTDWNWKADIRIEKILDTIKLWKYQ